MSTPPRVCFKVLAPDAGRADAPAVAATLRQLKGHPVDLGLCLTPLALEIRFSATPQDSRFVAAVIQHLYPGAKLERVTAEADPTTPPCAATVMLALIRPLPYPLALWPSFHPNDPVAALGGAVRELQPGERLESQLTLSPQEVTWRPPVGDARYLTPFARLLTTLPGVTALWCSLLGFFLGIGALYAQSVILGLPALLVLGLCGVGLWVNYQTLCWKYELPGPELDHVKSQDTLFEAALTLTAWAATPERARELVDLWEARYAVFGGANRWRVQPRAGLRQFLEGPRPTYLTAAEMAGHWHLPVDALQSPFSARQGYQPLMPPPLLLDPLRLPPASFPLGQYLDGTLRRPVYVPLDLLDRHTLVLGETQSGKSRLVERLCEGLLARPEHSLLVIDPHSSLVRRLAGKVPADRVAHTVAWDLGRTDQPVALNLLAAPGAEAASNVVADQLVEVLRALWSDSWGPRLEYHLGYLLRTLLAAHLPDMPTRPGWHPFTLLNVQSLITDTDFRGAVLNTLTDPDLQRYWRAEFRPLLEQPHLFQDVFMPILNKVGAYVQRAPARHIVGQFAFTPLLEQALTRSGCVLVDLAPSVVGADTARLVASTLLLTLRNLVAQRQHQPRETWRPLTVVVDELQWLNPGSLDRWMAELTKFRVNLIVITQSLELLDAADPHLRAQVLANVSNLFAFGLMADDARRIAPQFDGQVSVNDLLNLPPRHCYAKVVAGSQRQPVFSLETWTVAESDARLAEQLMAQTVAEHGTTLIAIRQDWATRQAALQAQQQGRVSSRELARR